MARLSAEFQLTLRLGNFVRVIRSCRGGYAALPRHGCYWSVIKRSAAAHIPPAIADGITGRTMSSGPSGTATARDDQPQMDSITRSGSL
jgi:hypothetical protein